MAYKCLVHVANYAAASFLGEKITFSVFVQKEELI